MHGPRRPGSTPPPAGAWRPSAAPLALALIVAVGVPAAWLMTDGPTRADTEPAAAPSSPTPVADARRTAAARAAGPAAAPAAIAAAPVRSAASLPAPLPQIVRHRDPDGDQTPDLADYVNPGETPTMAEVIARLHAAGVTSGLGAFQPPGTRPPLIGLAVPDDYELPVGYVRHYQATDDGQRIEPVLMFSPDYEWVDAAGRPVPLPANRVVPAEMAPPGLPNRRIVVPAPAEPGK